MSFDRAMARFLTLVEKVHRGQTARSENDLTAHLAQVIASSGLWTVADSTSSHSRKRPDILAYVSQEDADLVLEADVVVEAKKPEELRKYGTLASAITHKDFWEDKTLPYLLSNITKVQHFVVTTFTEFACVNITPELRRKLIQISRADKRPSG